jgi:hypothetical protein
MSILSATAKAIYQFGFEISPIILQNGLAATLPFGMLPIVTITQASSLGIGLLGGHLELGLDDYFCRFEPLPGATLVNNAIGRYPFANIAVAANAIISEPINVSMLMKCPISQEAGYISKFMTISALKGALDYHNSLGGTYIVATPSYVYTDCILLGLVDASSGASKQPQNAWRWDFIKPLVSAEDAAGAQSSLMSKLSSGGMVTDPSWSGLGTSIAPTLYPQLAGLVGGLL